MINLFEFLFKLFQFHYVYSVHYIVHFILVQDFEREVDTSPTTANAITMQSANNSNESVLTGSIESEQDDTRNVGDAMDSPTGERVTLIQVFTEPTPAQPAQSASKSQNGQYMWRNK